MILFKKKQQYAKGQKPFVKMSKKELVAKLIDKTIELELLKLQIKILKPEYVFLVSDSFCSPF